LSSLMWHRMSRLSVKHFPLIIPSIFWSTTPGLRSSRPFSRSSNRQSTSILNLCPRG
jgi:hypothetical protein